MFGQFAVTTRADASSSWILFTARKRRFTEGCTKLFHFLQSCKIALNAIVAASWCLETYLSTWWIALTKRDLPPEDKADTLSFEIFGCPMSIPPRSWIDEKLCRHRHWVYQQYVSMPPKIRSWAQENRVPALTQTGMASVCPPLVEIGHCCGVIAAQVNRSWGWSPITY